MVEHKIPNIVDKIIVLPASVVGSSVEGVSVERAPVEEVSVEVSPDVVVDGKFEVDESFLNQVFISTAAWLSCQSRLR